MVVVFANNQVIVAPSGVTNTITTDPVPLNGKDRIRSIAVIHYINNPNGTGVTAQAQASNDGVNWINVGTAFNATVADEFDVASITVPFAYIRYEFGFGATGAFGDVCFDFHTNIDHA